MHFWYEQYLMHYSPQIKRQYLITDITIKLHVAATYRKDQISLSANFLPDD